MRNLFVFIVTLLIASSAQAQRPLRVDVPKAPQVTQIEAGFPMGCQITSILYALKFGPKHWQHAYHSLSGASDVQKIQFLALKFSQLQSHGEHKAEPAFSPENGVDPNDLPWMIKTLVPEEEKLSLLSLGNLRGSNASQKDSLAEFLTKISSNLSANKPVLASLYFQKPAFSHAVLITGIADSSLNQRFIKINVLDPMTGKESEATIKAETIRINEVEIEGLSFDAPFVADRPGVLMQILVK